MKKLLQNQLQFNFILEITPLCEAPDNGWSGVQNPETRFERVFLPSSN